MQTDLATLGNCVGQWLELRFFLAQIVATGLVLCGVRMERWLAMRERRYTWFAERTQEAKRS